MNQKNKGKEKQLPTEIVAPILTILCGVLFLVWFFWPQSKEPEDAASFDSSLCYGDFAYLDVVSVVEPSPWGGENFLCKCTDPNGDRCWFLMSYEDYSDTFTKLLTRQEDVYDMGEFTYVAGGTVRIYGTVREVPRYSQDLLGASIIQMEYMELIHK